MKIKFTKTGKKDNWISIQKENGASMSFPWDAKSAGIPHDLIHFVVESKLKIQNGFWGSVNRGLKFEEATELSAQIARGVIDFKKISEVDGQSLKVTEAVVAAFTNVILWHESKKPKDCLTEINRRCSELNIEPPQFDINDVSEALIELAALGKKWNQMRDGESIEVVFG